MAISVRRLAIAGLLGAVCFVIGYIYPVLGFIPVPTPAGAATIMHIPAILGGVAEGPVVGAFVGFIFGLLSFLQATDFFKDPLISVLPRLFIGVTAAYSFVALRRFGLTTGLVGAAVVGTLTNTVLVLTMIVLRGHLAAPVAISLGVLHGTPEVVVAALLVTAIGMGLARAGLIREWLGGPAKSTDRQARGA